MAIITTFEYEKLLNDYGNKVYSFCLSLTKNKQDADDIYQESCLKAFKIVDKISKDDNPASFLCGMVLKVYRSQARKYARRNAIYDSKVVPIFNKEANDSIESEIEEKLIKEDISNAISKLDDIYRIPMILFYTQELKIEKIAEIMNIPEGTIKSRLNTARGQIKQYLRGRGYETY